MGDGRVKICDFGCARKMRKESYSCTTISGRFACVCARERERDRERERLCLCLRMCRYGVATISRLLKIQVSFAQVPYKRDDILEKRP